MLVDKSWKARMDLACHLRVGINPFFEGNLRVITNVNWLGIFTSNMDFDTFCTVSREFGVVCMFNGIIFIN